MFYIRINKHVPHTMNVGHQIFKTVFIVERKSSSTPNIQLFRIRFVLSDHTHLC